MKPMTRKSSPGGHPCSGQPRDRGGGGENTLAKACLYKGPGVRENIVYWRRESSSGWLECAGRRGRALDHAGNGRLARVFGPPSKGDGELQELGNVTQLLRDAVFEGTGMLMQASL